jgi:hypothetical protein
MAKHDPVEDLMRKLGGTKTASQSFQPKKTGDNLIDVLTNREKKKKKKK